MKSAVIVFPGSNCDRDVAVALEQTTGTAPLMVWHKETNLPKVDLVVLPGGFSYGDYLRAGALAAHSPIIADVSKHAEAGGLLMGICNGFQMLAETHILPGTVMRNRNLKFMCKDMYLRVENTETAFSKKYQAGEVIRIPIAHHDGNFFVTDEELKTLEDNDQIVFRYCAPDGAVTDMANDNGSVASIAGIRNKRGNVVGLMPHPERAIDPVHGNTDGLRFFEGLVS